MFQVSKSGLMSSRAEMDDEILAEFLFMYIGSDGTTVMTKDEKKGLVLILSDHW